MIHSVVFNPCLFSCTTCSALSLAHTFFSPRSMLVIFPWASMAWVACEADIQRLDVILDYQATFSRIGASVVLA
jgi:hypothetical protein